MTKIRLITVMAFLLMVRAAGAAFADNLPAAYTLLHSFAGGSGDGDAPYGSLTLSGSTLYGMTSGGGSNEGGTVFDINSDGTSYNILHNFGGSNDGNSPYGTLTLSGSTLYGMTHGGGNSGSGTVFSINSDGTGYTILHNFGGSNDGNSPYGSLTLSGSTLYGMTYGGGSNNYGTVFSINSDGTSYTVLYNFGGGDGNSPYGSLTLLGSTLYGMTYGGGSSGGGVVFKINSDGTGYTVLHNFGGSDDGDSPSGSLTLLGSTLYGMTYGGGSNNYGTVFKINSDGTNYATLYNFGGGDDGAQPYGSLTLSGSTLYGMTAGGGSSNYGTVFDINSNGTKYAILHKFGSSDGGGWPEGSLTLSGSTLYGMASGGGSTGLVFALLFTSVPNVVGEAVADANTTIADANLVIGTVTEEYSNTVVVGEVISQSPAAGTSVAMGSKVNYVESVGQPTVPDIVGMTSGNASKAITKADLKVGTVTTVYSDTVAKGNVISQSPAADTVVMIHSKVNYVKSLGEPSVPKVVGKTAADANTAIADVNLIVGTVITAYSNTVAAGKVISLSPIAGTKVAIGSDVNYVESLGKPTEPNIVGMTAADANATIVTVGGNLKVGTVTTAYSNTVAVGNVISQSPAAGKKVDIGSKVNHVESLGKPIVPNLVSMTSGNASKAISKADLKVGTITTAYSDTVAKGDVISTHPVAGTAVLIGSKVNYVKSLGEPVVPKVVGKTAADANTAIADADLVVGTVTTAYSTSVAAGKVISLSPIAGTKVAIGSDVNYVQSLGKNP